MIVQCPGCFRYYDDEFRLTLCPHVTFLANDGQNRHAHHPESYLSNDPPPPTPHRWTPEQARVHGRAGGSKVKRPKGLGKRRKESRG